MVRDSTIKKYLGNRYGRLVVKEFLARDPKHYVHYLFKCKCDCGNETITRISHLRQGMTTSCGCYNKQRVKETATGNTYTRLPSGEAVRNHVFYSYKKWASKRNLTFSISKEEFTKITQQPCFYCGSLPSKTRKGFGNFGTFTYNGIDRADNSIGYESGNILPCCNACNTKKNGVTKEMIFKLYHFFTQ